MNKTHFLFYYVQNSKSYIMTTPKHWAKANPNHFPDHFNNGQVPTVNEIEAYLIENYGFNEGPENEETKVLYNFNIVVPLANGLPFIG